MKRLLVLAAALGLLVAIGMPAGVVIAKVPVSARPVAVTTHVDKAKTKLDKKLRNAVESGSNATMAVWATVLGNPKPVLARLQGGRAATAPNGKVSLVVGRIRAQQLPKLASITGVVSVGLVQLKQTARPLGDPDPDLGTRLPSRTALKSAARAAAASAVPYADAPPIRKSNFEKLKKLALLDAKTHDFAEAWKMGYDGRGTTVSVLDGGTDWGHPDLIGTWKTDPDTGWPMAFDPFDTLVLLVDPVEIEQALTWYVETTAKKATATAGVSKVTFATRTGPSRNFAAPDGFKSHTYTFPASWSKSGTVRVGSHPDDHLLAIYGERPAILVTDPHTAGVYDTVYVDLNDDYDFGDEKPVTKQSPVSYRDTNADGYTDISGGLLYYISDGVDGSVLPGGPSAFGLDVTADPGELLAWTGDYDPVIEGHGTATASNVVGQGVIAGKAPSFGDVHGHRYPGAVIGGAPKAKAAPMGDIYFGFDFSTQFAYFLTNAAGVDVTSNSYGISENDNDGFDAGSQEAAIWNLAFGGKQVSVHATGNGGPGYGTLTPPKPFTGISVGASTQFGGTGWDSIRNASQITDNDVVPWSDRGPESNGGPGVDVVADGAYSAGDKTLNDVLDGNLAWETWGGTSRSTPVTVGAVALIYQAQRHAHGKAIPEGFAEKARAILKSSALDLGYDAYTQGAGSIQAGKAVRLALHKGGVIVTPDEWRPGDYRGDHFAVFPSLLAAGDTAQQRIDLDGPGTYKISDRVLKRVASSEFSFTTKPVTKEDPFNFNAPTYLFDVTKQVKAHPDADLMVVSAIFPHDELDANGDYALDQRWTLLAYDWSDLNHDGKLWKDRNHDGIVNHTELSTSSNIDGNPDLDWSKTEIEKGEYERFTYLRTGSNEVQVMVRDPKQRMHSGVFIGLQHPVTSTSVPITHLRFRVEFYKNVDWSWLSHPSSAHGHFTATMHVPSSTPAGLYQGGLVVSRNGHDTFVPISVTVPGTVSQAADGSISGALTFGGAEVARKQASSTYDNGSIFGANDWTWRAESGDWRFFYFDVPKDTPAGTLFLTDTTWNDTAPFTDLDTLVFGPTQNTFQLCCDDGTVADGAPYVLGTVGASRNTNVGDGVWTFDTATGGAEEVVSAPASGGLHAVVQHVTGFSGDKFNVPFRSSVGTASVSPSSVSVTSAANTGSFDVTFKASVDLPGLAADAFGLSQPSVTTQTAHQDDPNDPTTASVKKNFSLSHAARVTVSTALSTSDLDLYVLFDANHDGTFDPSEIVGVSAGATGDESVTLVSPADGNYQVWVHGFSVSGAPTFPLTIAPVQGNDLHVTGIPSGPIAAGTPVTLHVTYSKTMVSGKDYFGELQLGPSTAPSALSVPIVIHRS